MLITLDFPFPPCGGRIGWGVKRLAWQFLAEVSIRVTPVRRAFAVNQLSERTIEFGNAAFPFRSNSGIAEA